MDSCDIATLSASIIALIGSVVSLFISTRLAILKDRRQLLWSKELDRFFQLEELVGELVENLGDYRPIPEDRSELSHKFKDLERAAGRFARYPEVQQAIRDLHNTLGRTFAAKRDYEDDRDIRHELDPTCRNPSYRHATKYSAGVSRERKF